MEHAVSKLQSWTSRDIQIVEALTLKTRVMTLDQIARLWWPKSKNGASDAKKRILKLRKAGCIERYQINTHPIISMVSPVTQWRPNLEVPDFSSVAWKLKQRWILTHTPTWVFVATRRAANLFGSFGGKLKDPLQVTHDIHLSEVYLKYSFEFPGQADRWVGEDAFLKAGHGIKDPDAFLLDENGTITKVVEFGGKYSADRVEQFHRHCEERELEYELW